MKKTIFMLMFFALAIIVTAQDNQKNPCWKVSSFGANIGFGGAITSDTENDFLILKNAVDDPGLFIDPDDYKKREMGVFFDGMDMMSGYYTEGSGNGNFQVNLGLTPYCKKKGKYLDNRELRITLGGNMGMRNSFYYTKLETFAIDTFQSVNNSGIIYADSAIRKDYSYRLDYTDLNFGISYLFKTDAARRVRFYTGFGANYGIALRSVVSVDEEIYRTVYYYNEYDKPSEDDINYELFSNEDGHTYSLSETGLANTMHFVRAFIPLGLSLKISKKPASLFSHVDLYTEINPGVEFQLLSPEKTYINPYAGVGFIGFRYMW